jgi:hypothetical protein
MYNCTRYLMQIGKTLQTRLWYRQFQGERNVIHINDAQVERSMRESSQKTQMSNPRVTQAPSEPAMLSRNSLLFEARTETISFVKSSFHKLARQSLKKQVHKLHPERKKVTGRNNIQVKGKDLKRRVIQSDQRQLGTMQHHSIQGLLSQPIENARDAGIMPPRKYFRRRASHPEMLRCMPSKDRGCCGMCGSS